MPKNLNLRRKCLRDHSEKFQCQLIISGHHMFQLHKLEKYADVCSDLGVFSPSFGCQHISCILISSTTFHMKYNLSLIFKQITKAPVSNLFKNRET
jgi:hypothetical protein